MRRSPPVEPESPVKPTLNIENAKIGVFPLAAASPIRVDSTFTGISETQPFAYPNMNLSPVTRKARFRALFGDHFENARGASKDYISTVSHQQEKVGKHSIKF